MKAPGRKGLIVEDDDALAFVLAQYLAELNIEAGTACHGLEAIDKVKSYNYDFILMDIHMPIMNGLEATKQIMFLKPESIILVITSSHEQLECLRMLALGAKECLKKPINPIQLKKLLFQYVSYTQ